MSLSRFRIARYHVLAAGYGYRPSRQSYGYRASRRCIFCNFLILG